MDRHFRYAGLTLMTLILEIIAVTESLDLLNQPNTALFVFGLAIIFGSAWLTAKILWRIQKLWLNSKS